MRFFWQISCEIATWTIRKMTAARTRIWGCRRHYMELNFGLFLKTGQFNPLFSDQSEKAGFTSVFPDFVGAG